LAQAVSRLPVTAKYRVRSQVTHCKICGGRDGTVTGLSPSTHVPPVSSTPPTLHTLLHLHVAPTTTNGRSHRSSSLVTGLSPSTHVPPVSSTPPTLHTLLHLHVARTTTNGRSQGTFQRQCSFGNGEHRTEKCLQFVAWSSKG